MLRPLSKTHAPPSRVEIDWSLPLARGLTGAWLFNGNFVDHVGGVAATQGSTSAFANTAAGTQFKVDGTANSHITVPSANVSTPSLSIVSLFNPATLGGGYVGVFTNRGAAGSQQILLKSSGKLAVYFWNGSQVSYDGTGASTLTTGKLYSVAATYTSAAGLIGYVNGAQDGTASGGADLTTSMTTTTWGSDSFDYTARTLTGTIGPSALWNRALSAQEVAWLAAEPFALFRATRRRRFYVATTPPPVHARPRITMVL